MTPAPEAAARQEIDRHLRSAGWAVQDRVDQNIHAGPGVAVREFPLPGHGFADYLLYVDARAAGVVEAKPAGTTLTGVEVQTGGYADAFPKDVPAHMRPLPFLYQSTGVETRFTNRIDPEPRSRGMFSFHRPETLRQWIAGAPEALARRTAVHVAAGADAEGPADRAASGRADLPLAAEPGTRSPLILTPRVAYGVGSANLRSGLLDMPPLRHPDLWDAQRTAITNLERSLAENRPRALIQMATGSGKTFTAVASIYRLIKHAGARRVLFLVDRSNLGRQAKGEFDGFIPPGSNRAFSDEYNVQHLASNKLDDVARVTISTIQRLYSILKGEPELDEEADEKSLAGLAGLVKEPVPVEYNPSLPIEYFDVVFIDECHRSIYSLWRQVLEYFDAFLIGLTATPSKQTFGFFDQNLVMEYGHQQAVVDHVNVDYDICRIRTRITREGSVVESDYVVEKRDREMRERRNDYMPCIAVTVDMIATGTDIKPLEVVLFMRDVKSRVLFEQMKGRGVHVIGPDELRAVTSDAKSKSRFVDAVGVADVFVRRRNHLATRIFNRHSSVAVRTSNAPCPPTSGVYTCSAVLATP